MPDIPFTCPHCDHFVLVEASFAGQTGPCANCGLETTIPASARDEDVKKAHQDAEREEREALPVLLSSLGAIVGIAILILIAAAGVVWPMIARRDSNKKLKMCSSNLARIGIALNQYHQFYGAYPPPAIRDANGKPLLSWRVLILPFIGAAERADYNRIDLTKSWDHPSNKPFTSKPRGIFGCPASQSSASAITNYLAITGKGTAFDPTRRTSKVQVKDGLARTICIVEVHGSAVNWAEPVDLDINRISFKMNAQPGKDISSAHRSRVCHALCCDGTARAIHPSTRPSELRAMATISGGEPGLK